MTNSEIVDTLDDMGVALWRFDNDKKYPTYTGAARAHYREMARIAIRAMANPPWYAIDNNTRHFKKFFGMSKSEALLLAYHGILETILVEKIRPCIEDEEDDQ